MSNDKTEYVNLLRQLIGYYENDLVAATDATHYSKFDVERAKQVTNSMIIEVTKFVNDIRYCSRVKCPCSPESGIKKIYDSNKDIFKNTLTALYPIPYKTIEKIIKEL